MITDTLTLPAPAGETSAKPPITHVLVVVDRSGSMLDHAAEARQGFNTYLDSLRAARAANPAAARYRLTVTLFSATTETVCTAAKLRQVPRLDEHSYCPHGSTALYDAIGATITRFEADTPLDPLDQVLLVTVTDGMENSSQEFTAAQINEMIDARVEGGRWTSVALLAGRHAWRNTISRNTQRVNTSGQAGTIGQTYSALAAGTVAYAASGATAQDVGDALRAAVGVDTTDGGDTA